MPLATPFATPLPEKSSAFVICLVRSISGSTLGMLMGAVRTWKPFGGGGATSCGGGFGGGAFFTSTKLIFSSRFSFFAVACSVAYAAATRRTVWRKTLPTIPPTVRCLTGLDSSKLLNKSAPLADVVNRNCRPCDRQNVHFTCPHGKTGTLRLS